MSCCLLLCGFSLVLMWCKAKCCPTIGGLPSCVGVMSGSLCGGVVFRGARACVEPTTFPKYVAVSMVSTSVWIPGTKLLGGFLFGLYFFVFFPFLFVLFFPVFWLRWFSWHLHRELRSPFAWYLQHFGVWISH